MYLMMIMEVILMIMGVMMHLMMIIGGDAAD